MNIIPNFHFDGECAQALKVYLKVLGGELTCLIKYKDADPNDFDISGLSSAQLDQVYHAEIVTGKQRLLFSDSLRGIKAGENLSLVIVFDCPEQVIAAYEMLIEGGSPITPLTDTTYSSCFASLKDRFGNRWELMTENSKK